MSTTRKCAQEKENTVEADSTARVRGKVKLQFNDVSFQLGMYFVLAQHIVNVHTVCSAIHSQMDPLFFVLV